MKDKRGRRTRNTLCVDLGRHGPAALDHCTDLLGAWARARGNIAARGVTRGKVIRIALKLLALELAGADNALAKATGISGEGRIDIR